MFLVKLAALGADADAKDQKVKMVFQRCLIKANDNQKIQLMSWLVQSDEVKDDEVFKNEDIIFNLIQEIVFVDSEVDALHLMNTPPSQSY